MARASASNFNLDVGNITSFNAHFKAFSDAIKQVLTQTADTGQVNFTTNTTRGDVYEIYRFNDALQTGSPIFIKIIYSPGSGTPNQPYYYISVGTGSNGAGTLTGLLMGQTLMNNTIGDSSSVYSGYVSNGDGSQFTSAWALNPNITATNNWWGLEIERYRNPDGTPNGDGVNITAFVNNQLAFSSSRTFAGNGALNAQPANEFAPPVLVAYARSATTHFSGNTEYAFPFNTWGPANPTTAVQPIVWKGASQALMLGLNVDYPRLAVINLTHYGRSMQFLALGSAAAIAVPTFSAIATAAAANGYSPLIRWE